MTFKAVEGWWESSKHSQYSIPWYVMSVHHMISLRYLTPCANPPASCPPPMDCLKEARWCRHWWWPLVSKSHGKSILQVNYTSSLLSSSPWLSLAPEFCHMFQHHRNPTVIDDLPLYNCIAHPWCQWWLWPSCFKNILCHSLIILLAVNVNSIMDTVVHQLVTTQQHIQIDKSRMPLRVDKYIWNHSVSWQ